MSPANAAPSLPESLKFFETPDGRRIFNQINTDGSLSANLSAVIVHHLTDAFTGNFGGFGLHDSEEGRWFRMDIRCDDDQKVFADHVDQAVKALLGASQETQ